MHFPYLLLFPRMSGWVDLKFFVSYLAHLPLYGFPYLLTNFSKDVCLSWPQIFFVSSLFATLPDFLTYILLFRRTSGWVDLNFFFRILLFYHFTRFPYLLTTFSRDVRLSWPQKIFFSYLAYLLLNRISLLTYYFYKGCQAELT